MRTSAVLFCRFFDELNQNKLTVSSDVNKSEDSIRPIRPTDESVIKVYNADGTYTAVRVSAETRASAVLKMAAKKLQLEGSVVLAEIKSNGGKAFIPSASGENHYNMRSRVQFVQR